MIEDNYLQIAYKIYNKFRVGDIIQITGFSKMAEDTVVATGELVCEELYKMDRYEHVTPAKGKVPERRKCNKMPGSIGGHIAHKIFRYQYVIKDGIPVYTIWRYQ